MKLGYKERNNLLSFMDLNLSLSPRQHYLASYSSQFSESLWVQCFFFFQREKHCLLCMGFVKTIAVTVILV